MPVPAYPYNRHEQYLNRIATGDGDIPPYPQNREEQYLAAIVENGGGGSGGGVLVVNDVDGTLDKTWQEIYESDFAVLIYKDSGGKETYMLGDMIADSGEYDVNFISTNSPDGRFSYSTDSASGYPIILGD